MERLVRGKLEAGRPVYFRLSEIDVERADVDRRLSELRSERAQIDATLVQLVGVAPDVSPPQITLERWRGNDPHALWPVRIAETEIGKAEAGIREKRAEYRPDFGVRLQYQQREAGVSGGMPFSGDDWFSAGVSVSVPLWAAQNQAPRLRAARAQEAAARASLHDALRATRERLEALYSAHQAAQENLGIFRTKEKSLRELVEAARRNYEAGRGSNIQVLDGEIGLLTLRAQIEDERARALATAARANSFLVP